MLRWEEALSTYEALALFCLVHLVILCRNLNCQQYRHEAARSVLNMILYNDVKGIIDIERVRNTVIVFFLVVKKH